MHTPNKNKPKNGQNLGANLIPNFEEGMNGSNVSDANSKIGFGLLSRVINIPCDETE